MNFNVPDSNFLISESIKDMIPDLTDEIISQARKKYITVSMELLDEQQSLVVAGSLSGVSIENVIKIDIRTKIEIGFQVVSRYVEGEKYVCKDLVIAHGDLNTHFEDELDVSSPKIYDLDHENMLCTLALDLARKSDNYNTVHHGKTSQDQQ